MSNLGDTFEASASAVAALGCEAAAIAALSDAQLLDAQTSISAHRRHLDGYAARVAGEIAVRSHRDLGDAGLAQRNGFLSPEAMIQSAGRITRAEATRYVQVGTMMADVAAGFSPTSAWQSPLVESVGAGRLSVDGADAIRRGLGLPDAAVTVEALREAAVRLVGEAQTVDADRIFRLARDLRDELDAQSVERREKEQHDQRFLKIWKRRDGMVGGTFLYGPEDGALLIACVDALTSPRRGGPRFVDKQAKAAAEKLLEDPRSNEQVTADAFIGMLRLASETDPGTIFGMRRPAVRLVVTEQSLATGTGDGLIEDTLEPVSRATIERHLCDAGILPIRFDDGGQSLNLGRTQRHFSAKQRAAMAVRDGGCRALECNRPPSCCSVATPRRITLTSGSRTKAIRT